MLRAHAWIAVAAACFLSAPLLAQTPIPAMPTKKALQALSANWLISAGVAAEREWRLRGVDPAGLRGVESPWYWAAQGGSRKTTSPTVGVTSWPSGANHIRTRVAVTAVSPARTFGWS